MIKVNRKSILKLMYAALSATLLFSNAQAGTITVVADTEVKLVIEGGAGSVSPSKEDIKTTVLKNEPRTFTITKGTFGLDTFTVTGKGALPSVDNSCKLLSIEKDYKISFTSTKTGGIICKSESLLEAIK